MTSYDENIRYEDLLENYRDRLNGMNLFFEDPSVTNPNILPHDAIVIAFDLPKTVVAKLLAGNVSRPEPLPAVEITNEWDFMGFDVVDPITQTSGLHAFSPEIEQVPQYDSAGGVCLNLHGLLDNEELAGKVSLSFNERFHEHAPFACCGVWKKR